MHEKRQFLGLTNYFRKFIDKYADSAEPLQRLTNKGQKFSWGPDQEQAFHALKTALCNAPVLVLPDLNKPFQVFTDASLIGTGAVLMQDEKPVAYTSKKFTPAERNYHTTDHELLGAVRALSEWRCYLEGADVTIMTDHNSLVHLQTQPQLNRRQVRWLEFLSRFEPGLKWQYKPGKTLVADPLSRNPALCSCCIPKACVLCPSVILDSRPQHDLLTRIKNAYASDTWLQENKAQFRRHQDLYLMANRIVVPNSADLKTELIQASHAPRYAGHRGIRKTLAELEKTFWWPKQHLDVKHFVRTCDACQRHKHVSMKPAGLLKPLQIPSRRWEHVSMDLITDLPKTPRQHDAIIVFVDKLSKFVRFAPTKTDISSSEAAHIFTDRVVSLFGLPKKLITDRDPRFTSNMFREFCRLFDIKNAFSTAFHPQTDGQTERYNQVLEDMLRHYISPDQTNWDELLPAAEFAVNNSKHDSTQETPAFLMQGQHPLTPITIQTDSAVPAARLHASQLEQAIKDVQHNLHNAQQRQKTYADQHRRDVNYSVGDKVLLSTKNLNFQTVGTRKFLPKFIGPFPVTQLVGDAAVRLKLPHTYRMHPVFHVSLLKPYRQSEHTQTPPPPLRVDDMGIPIYEVEKVLAHKPLRLNRRCIWQYLVKWEGYGHEHNTWEPETNIETKDLTLEPYWKALGGRIPPPKSAKTPGRPTQTKQGHKRKANTDHISQTRPILRPKPRGRL